LLENCPGPEPFTVLSEDNVGALSVFQQTPLSSIAEEPSSVIKPPLTAEVAVISVTGMVVSTGASPEQLRNIQVPKYNATKYILKFIAKCLRKCINESKYNRQNQIKFYHPKTINFQNNTKP
jgi:hypothetical protein